MEKEHADFFLNGDWFVLFVNLHHKLQ
jgi:hypothetical protein